MHGSKCVSLGMIAMAAAVLAGGMVIPRPASAQDTTAAPKPKPKGQKGNSNLITEWEVANSANGATNAYELIERVRPSMLRRRSSTTGQGSEGLSIVAYVDDTRSGDVETLRSISIGQIKEIRYLSSTDATQRWGTGLMNGVIQVISKR